MPTESKPTTMCDLGSPLLAPLLASPSLASPSRASPLLASPLLGGGKVFGEEIEDDKRVQRSQIFDLEDVVKDDVKIKQGEKEPPYSFRNEICFFYQRGIPLGLSALLQWGIPSMFTMIMAGRTPNSMHLQRALGYGRVFYNITLLMILWGFCSYFTNVLPGCIGSGRQDRIPMYFWRSVLLTLLFISPFLILQFFSAPIMAYLGVDAHANVTTASWNGNATTASWNVSAAHDVATMPTLISDEMGLYTRLMTVTAVLTVLENHLMNVFVNLGYVKSAAINALVTGLGLDLACTYLFIYHWRLGVYGAALSQIAVKGCRCLFWCLFASIYGKWGVFCKCRTRGKKPEPFLTLDEARVFFRLSVPAIISYFGSWFIFELQIMVLAHIRGIGQAALAAGAIWIQSENVVSSIQTGWITVVKLRVLNLMGAQDPGASKAFAILCLLSAGMTLVSNIALVGGTSWIAKVVSNEPEVQRWFARVVWLLALHSQTRVSSINLSSLFVGFKKPVLANVIIYGSYYFLAAPLTIVISLTDFVTEDVFVKFAMCLGTACLGQGLVMVFAAICMCRFDWEQIASDIADRANTDKKPDQNKIPDGYEEEKSDFDFE